MVVPEAAAAAAAAAAGAMATRNEWRVGTATVTGRTECHCNNRTGYTSTTSQFNSTQQARGLSQDITTGQNRLQAYHKPSQQDRTGCRPITSHHNRTEQAIGLTQDITTGRNRLWAEVCISLVLPSIPSDRWVSQRWSCPIMTVGRLN